jgi:hypothetical protein
MWTVWRSYGDALASILDADAAGHETAAWIAKEELRDVLNLRARVSRSALCERNVRDRLFAYDWCAQHEDIRSRSASPRR